MLRDRHNVAPRVKRRQIVTQIFGVFVFVQNGSIMFVFVESFA